MKEVKELVIEISRGRAVDIPKIKAYGKRRCDWNVMSKGRRGQSSTRGPDYCFVILKGFSFYSKEKGSHSRDVSRGFS